MDLHKVQGNGCQLYFPAEFPQDTRYRGREGYIVDLDAPMEREWCAGQMHKLVPAPQAKEADPITHPIALRLIKAEVVRLASLPSKAESEALVGAGVGEGDPLEVKPARAARKAG